jgi:peptidoglycan/LPS O-acetylase OafA/YrhL
LIGAPKPRRYVALDGLRGIAALIVILFHIHWTNHLTGSNAIRHGFLFVDLFFMLSGFVLAASYLERIRSRIELGHFLLLRFFRVYPMHIAMLLAMIALELLKVAGLWTGIMVPARTPFSGTDSFGDIFLNVFLIQSLGTTDHLSWNNPSWSISCEAAGYVAFGFATLAGMTKTKVLQIMAVPMAVAGYVVVLHLKGTLDATYDFGVIRCLAGLFLGVWAYNLTQVTRISFIEPGTLGIMAVGVAAWVIVTLCFVDGITEAIVIPGFLLALLFLHQDRGIATKVLCSRSIRFLGLISYSIYMVHFPILVSLGMALKRIVPASSYSLDEAGLPQLAINPWLGDGLLLIVVALILLVASFTFSRIEKPWREYGRSQIGGNLLDPSTSGAANKTG